MREEKFPLTAGHHPLQHFARLHSVLYFVPTTPLVFRLGPSLSLHVQQENAERGSTVCICQQSEPGDASQQESGIVCAHPFVKWRLFKFLFPIKIPVTAVDGFSSKKMLQLLLLTIQPTILSMFCTRVTEIVHEGSATLGFITVERSVGSRWAKPTAKAIKFD